VLVAGWARRIIWFLLFLVVPGMVDRWFVGGELNMLRNSGFLDRQVLRGGAQLIVFVWMAAVLLFYLLTMRSQRSVLEYKEASV
jgi:hypothetical protein